MLERSISILLLFLLSFEVLYGLIKKSKFDPQYQQQLIDETLKIQRDGNTTIINIGYIAGFSHRPGKNAHNYIRTSRYISGALSYGISVINTLAQSAEFNDTESPLPKGYQLNIKFIDTYGDSLKSVKGVVEMCVDNDTWAIIGAQDGCQIEAHIAVAYNMFMISYLCTDNILADSNNLYKTFVRTRPQVSGLCEALVGFLKEFNWMNIALFATTDEKYQHILDSCRRVLKKTNITLLHSKMILFPAIYYSTRDPFKKVLQDTYRTARIYVFIGHEYEAMSMLMAMNKLKLFETGNYFLIAAMLRRQTQPNDRLYKLSHSFPHFALIEPTKADPKSFKNLTKIFQDFNTKPPFSQVRSKELKFIPIESGYLYDAVWLYAKAVGAVLRNNSLELARDGGLLKSLLTGYEYRSILGYMNRINLKGELIGNYTVSQIFIYDTNKLVVRSIGLFWPDDKERLKFKSSLDRKIKWINGVAPLDVPKCGFNGDLCSSSKISKMGIIIGLISAMLLMFMILLILKMRYDKNEKELERLLWKINPSEINMEKESELMMKLMFVRRPPVMCHKDGRIFLPFEEDSDMTNNAMGSSAVVANFVRINSCFNIPMLLSQYTALNKGNIGLGIYKNQEVVIKKYPFNGGDISLTRGIKKELKMLRDVSCINLNKFLGAIIETQQQQVATVWEFCDHGSLQDVLYGTRLTSDHPVFLSSFAYDLISGLSFLHEHPYLQPYHANLKSSNCLIDNRWTVRLSDFGTTEFLANTISNYLNDQPIVVSTNGTPNQNQAENQKNPHLFYLSLFWTAPELLRQQIGTNGTSHQHIIQNPEFHSESYYKPNSCTNKITNPLANSEACEVLLQKSNTSRHSNSLSKTSIRTKLKLKPHLSSSNNKLDNSYYQKADIYSLAMIFYEIHTCQMPFFIDYITQKSPKEIIRRIIVLNDEFKVPYRPKLSLLSRTDNKVTDLIEACWQENSNQRPTVKTIYSKLKSIFGEKKNLVECMKEKMTVYTKNLEKEVMRRTEELREEKKQNEELLYQMLPVSVAEQLRQKKQVEAEAFDCVSIYFSDIVGFTKLASALSPFEVVNLLNLLYTSFDRIIENYRVYKVETIGDSYMVVSGLPTPFAEHATEMADMSLRLLEEITKGFVIPSQQYKNEILKLRIGLHSGPCCAGVVGTRNPRYCLFGDTVNMASRMESTGEACKIHCSESFKNELSNSKVKYNILSRGKTEVKGKGSVDTFWLMCKIEENGCLLNYEPTSITKTNSSSSFKINLTSNNKSLCVKSPYNKKSKSFDFDINLSKTNPKDHLSNISKEPKNSNDKSNISPKIC